MIRPIYEPETVHLSLFLIIRIVHIDQEKLSYSFIFII
jgi:hypothetical protein